MSRIHGSGTPRTLRRGTLASALLLLPGCATFATVRSAEVPMGPAVHAQTSRTGNPGEDVAWMHSFYCEAGCNQTLTGLDVGVSNGFRPQSGPKAVSLGVGLAGVSPYVEGYFQLREGPKPWGVGARLGIPVTGWAAHQMYGRFDVPLGMEATLLLNPGLYVMSGTSPNGEVSGSFVGLVQGVGVAFGAGGATFTPGLAVVSGRAHRAPGYSQPDFSSRAMFLTASIGVSFHRAPPAARVTR